MLRDAKNIVLDTGEKLNIDNYTLITTKPAVMFKIAERDLHKISESTFVTIQ
jgi:hypothetical protein